MPTTYAPVQHVHNGKEARTRARRRSHGDFDPRSDRPDPVSLLEEQAASRVPELVPIRYGRMLASPFAFFRGAALVMASDLEGTPTSGFTVQACGDAHLSNFGLFGTPERELAFDLNDFDETAPGPWEWDVKRLAASLCISARELSFTAAERRGIVTNCARQYREAMRAFAGQSELEVWYAKLDADWVVSQFASELPSRGRKRAKKVVAKARTKDSMQALDKLTAVVDGERRIVADPPLIVPVGDLLPQGESQAMIDQLRRLITSYRRTLSSDRRVLLDRFELLDIARKVVGVGSVGTRCWIILLRAREHGEPLFLQAKEAEASVLERFVGPSRYNNCGQRVVAGQRLMQAASDIFLGWQSIVGLDGVQRDFYVRQLRDWKGSVDTTDMVPSGMDAYGRLCGWTLARAHARSGDRIAIGAYLGSSTQFEDAIARFTETYADQNERDYEALQEAAATGRIVAEMGV